MANYFNLNEFRRLAQPRSARKIYLYAFILGLAGGGIALLFEFLLNLAQNFTLNGLANLDLKTHKGPTVFSKAYWWLLALPIIGAFISGLIVQFYDISAKGAGMNAMIDAFHNRAGWLRMRTPFAKLFATIATLAGGGSAGKEGPLAQIGASLGSIFSRFLGVGPRAMRTLFLAGMAGALGAIFRAPLGAALTSVEVLYREDYESESLIPSIISSVTAYFVFTSVWGFDTTFKLPEHGFSGPIELLIYFVLGLACFLIGLFFVKIYDWVRLFFNNIPLPLFLRVTLGGVMVSFIGALSFESLGSGFGFLQQLMAAKPISSHSPLSHWLNLKGPLTLNDLSIFLAILIAFKIFATAFTVGSGQSGGVFGPSLFIGGLIGALVGNVTMTFFPGVTASYVPFIVVGMAGFFAGVANAPMASVVMVCELTGSYVLLAPLMVVTIISIILSRKFSIYQSQKLNKFESPAHEWDMTNNFLQDISVKDTVISNREEGIAPLNMPLKKLIKYSFKTHHTDFIVKDEQGKYAGTLSLRYMSEIEKKEASKKEKIVGDALENEFEPLRMGDSLAQGLERLINYDIDKVGVINDANDLKGYLTFRDILKAYQQRIEKKRQTNTRSN